MKIGCVKEIKNNEFRVGLTPDNVRAYVAAGHHVYMERAQVSDRDSLTTSMWMQVLLSSTTLQMYGICQT